MRFEKPSNIKENMLHEGARRTPTQGLKASGALLGAMWAQSGRQERFKSVLVAARGGGRPEKNHGVPRGGLLARKTDRLQAPRGAPGLPQGLPESLPESIWELFCQLAVEKRVFCKTKAFPKENNDF